MATAKTNIENLAIRAATEDKALRTLINGNVAGLGSLNTANKTNLVAAINEVFAALSGAGANIDDGVISALSVWSSSKTNTEIAAAIAALVDASPGTLDTLNELAAALGDDPNFAATISAQIGAKADSNNPVFTGTITAPVDSIAMASIVGLPAQLNAKITAPTDPNADRILFWDDSAGIFTWLSLSGMAISGTTMSNSAATESALGVVELATLAEMTTGTDTTRVATVAGVRQEINTRAATAHTHTASQITDFNTAADARVNALVPAATDAVAGKVELATLTEVGTGTDTTRAVTPEGVRQEINTRAATVHTHTSSQITDFSTAVPAAVPSASDTVQGKVELATLAEMTTGTDTTRAATPAGVRQEINTRAATSHTHTASQVTDLATAVPSLVPSASETVQGKVELATLAEMTTGTSTSLVPTVAGVRQEINTRAAASHTHTASQVTDFSTAADARVNALVPSASETVQGKVELATTVETTTGTDTARAVTPAGLKAVADTKAAAVHGHALTDANITGVLPIAQVPTGTSGTTVALGNHTHVAANITDFNSAASAAVPAASQTAQGKIEIATDTEVITGTDAVRAVTPAGLRAHLGNLDTDFVAVFEAALV